MTHFHRTRILPLLALGVMLAASAGAQDRRYQESGGTSLQITFGSSPHWVGVPGTQVRQIRQGDQTDYDVFRYGRTYYAYSSDNNRWYMSRNYRGQFMLISNRSVPRELRRIPRSHWRNYPSDWQDRSYRDSRGSNGWQNRDDRGSNGWQNRHDRGSNATFQVSFGNRPRWSSIGDTRIETVYGTDRPNYDVFRYGGNYYVYSGNSWYTSTRESGQFTLIDDRSVPSEFSRVPREEWRNYPSGWDNQDNNGYGRGDYRTRQRNGRGGN